MSDAEWLALLSFATVMAFTPGPNTTLSAALAAQGGLRRAGPFVLAVPVGCLRQTVKWAGLLVLLWLAWQLAQRRSLAQADGGLHVGFAQGVALQFVNIKAWMNALLISAGWVTVADNVLVRAAQVLPVMMLYGLLSNLAYALVGAALRQWLAQGQRLLVFNRVLALVLVATAGWMAWL
jgi:threonine/homoserine/homoserine lactone efflux protein